VGTAKVLPPQRSLMVLKEIRSPCLVLLVRKKVSRIKSGANPSYFDMKIQSFAKGTSHLTRQRIDDGIYIA
jgi:hypothetical protein